MQKIKELYARLSRWAFPVLGVLLFVSIATCNGHRGEVSALHLNLDSVALLAKHFENNSGQVVAENTQLKASAGDLKVLTDSIFNLKKENSKSIKTVQQYARIIQQGNFNNKKANWVHDTLEVSGGVAREPEDTNLIRVPKPFTFEDSTIKFSGYVSKTGVIMDSIHIENTVHLRTIVNKVGFLRLGRETTVQVLNSNKGITTKGVTSLVVPVKTSAWNKYIKPILSAALAAYGTSQLKK